MDPVIYDPDLVIVVLRGAKHPVQIHPNATVLDLKVRILGQLGISVETQNLYYKGQNLRDEVKMQNYLIPHGAEINMVLKIHLWVRKGDIHYGLVVTDRMKVGELKATLHVQFGLPIEMELQLTHEPNHYLNDRSFLHVYGIIDGTELIVPP